MKFIKRLFIVLFFLLILGKIEIYAFENKQVNSNSCYYKVNQDEAKSIEMSSNKNVDYMNQNIVNKFDINLLKNSSYEYMSYNDETEKVDIFNSSYDIINGMFVTTVGLSNITNISDFVLKICVNDLYGSFYRVDAYDGVFIVEQTAEYVLLNVDEINNTEINLVKLYIDINELTYGSYDMLEYETNINLYKKTNYLKYYFHGDANLDCLINTKDLGLIRQYIVGKTELSNLQLYFSDVNKDGVVNTSDLGFIQQDILINDYSEVLNVNVKFLNDDGITSLYDYNGNKIEINVYDMANDFIVVAPDVYKEGYYVAGWLYKGVEIDLDNYIFKPSKDVYSLSVIWKPSAHTMIFDTDGGSYIAPITQEYGSLITKPANPTKEGYTFIGWSQEIPSTMPADDITIKALWSINSYTITFGSESYLLEYGTKIQVPTNSTKEGNTFIGWSLVEPNTLPSDTEIPETMPAYDMTFEPLWEINYYTITFDTIDGSYIAPITQEYGSVITKPEAPTREGYKFSGWSQEIPSTMPAGNITIKARWDQNKYEITFDTNGGNDIAPINQFYRSNIKKPAAPTKEGHTFLGWTLVEPNTLPSDTEIPETMPAYDMTFKALWETNYYTITFNTDGGNDIESITQEYESVIIKPADPIREGYKFIGWDKGIPNKMPAYNMTIKALWSEHNYCVKFDTDGGNDIAPITQKYGSIITKPVDPTKEGHTFMGWTLVEPSTLPSDTKIPETMPENNMTFKAEWIENEYTIIFNTNGGNDIDPITQEYGSIITIPADPTRIGYTFEGWILEEQSALPSDTKVPETIPAYDITIKALWSINSHTITFGSESYLLEYGATIPNPTNPTKEGHTFVGWTLVEPNTLPSDTEIPETMPDYDMTYIALWNINSYTITFGDESITADYGTEIKPPVNLTKEGNTFVGWTLVEPNTLPSDTKIPETMPAYDMTFEPLWETNYYTITFDTDGGSFIAPITQEYGSLITKPSNPTKEGYTFIGWSRVLPSTMPANDMIITAQFLKSSYDYIEGVNYTRPCSGSSTKSIDGSRTVKRYTITDSGRENQPYDSINLGDLTVYKDAGFKTVTISISIEIAQSTYDGLQWIFLYSCLAGREQLNNNFFILRDVDNDTCGWDINHSPNKGPNKSYKEYCLFTVVPIDNIINGELMYDNIYIVYGAEGENEDTWYNKGLTVNVKFNR